MGEINRGNEEENKKKSKKETSLHCFGAYYIITYIKVRKMRRMYRPDLSPTKTTRLVDDDDDDDIFRRKVLLQRNDNNKNSHQQKQNNNNQRTKKMEEQIMGTSNNDNNCILMNDSATNNSNNNNKKKNMSQVSLTIQKALNRMKELSRDDEVISKATEKATTENIINSSLRVEQTKTQEYFNNLTNAVQKVNESVETERRIFLLERMKLETRYQEMENAMENARFEAENAHETNAKEMRQLREERERLMKDFQENERRREQEKHFLEKRRVSELENVKEKENRRVDILKTECEGKVKRIKEESALEINNMKEKYELQIEKMRMKLEQSTENDSEKIIKQRKKALAMENEMQKLKKQCSQLNEEKEALQKASAVALSKLELLENSLELREDARNKELRELREKSTSDYDSAKVKIEILENRARTAETASIAVRFLCEEAQNAIEDSEVAAAYAERRAARLAAGFGNSSSSESDENENERNNERNKKVENMKFRKRADAANLRLERSLKDARATLRECIERKKNLLLLSENDSLDEEEEAYEIKRREMFAFNVVKDVAELRVAFLTRSIASVRLSRRCGALEGLIAGRAKNEDDDDIEEKLNNTLDDLYTLRQNSNVDAIGVVDEDDDEYVSW